MNHDFTAEQNRPTAAELADQLLDFVCDQIEALADRHAPRLVLPRVFAGHAVGPDTRSDLAYTLSLLFEAGRETLAGLDLEPVVLSTLCGLDGPSTHTFYSYRAAEALLRFGGYHQNPRLAHLDDAALANLRQVFDSTAIVDAIRNGHTPANYAVVVARCEHARDRLGLLDDSTLLDELCGRAREMIGSATDGWIDDSRDDRGQFDIYTPDVLLFAEPLADRIGRSWTQALRHVLGDVDALALPGGAIVWGRSIGALGIAMTLELAGIGVGRGLVDNPPDWLARAKWALDEMRDWFSDGVIRAHQHRSTMFYRGPARRLQMTLDVLGKLVQAAIELQREGALRAGRPFEAWRPVDRFIAFDPEGGNRSAGAWAHRSEQLSFVLPLVGGGSTEYFAAPRSPGLFEVPVTAPISGIPVVYRSGKSLIAAGAPTRVSHRPGALEIEFEGWREPAAGPATPPALAGGRRVQFRVEGRSLVVEETLELEVAPTSIDGLALQVPALAQRPLDVQFSCDTPHRVDTIDVAGLAEYRSFWSEIEAVHQIDIEPAQRTSFQWRVTPKIRLASTAFGHPYDRALYQPLGDRLQTRLAPANLVNRPRWLQQTDVLHLHWPEWWQGLDLDRNRAAIATLADAGVRIVMTQHNLVPHRIADEGTRALYQMWAQAAQAVIHHTKWGREKALEAYDYGADTLHRTIPHGHWGQLYRGADTAAQRAVIEAELGLAPCRIRLGVIGAPRAQKDVQLVLDAFHASAREDLQLLVVCLEDETVPEDPRITTLRAAMVPPDVYLKRLAAIDVLVFPFHHGMLMTGTAFDAIGAERAAVISDWPALQEVFGDAAILYGSTRDDLTACLDALTEEQVKASAGAMRRLQAQTAWADIAERTFSLLEEISD